MRVILFATFAALALPVQAQDRPLVPERRMVLSEGVDLVGRDLGQIFDTTLEACEAACLADPRCEAMTYNARARSCFPKAEVTGSVPYQGAYAGLVRAASAGAQARAATRAADLGFLPEGLLPEALDQARALGRTHVTGDWSEAELLDALTSARAAGATAEALRLTGAVLNLADAADQWIDYARLTLEAPAEDRSAAARRAAQAAVNGYLRAPSAPVQAEALLTLAAALEQAGEPRGIVPALRLATKLSKREDIAAALEDAIGKFGFRIVEHQVESNLASPRLCAVFSEDLGRGVDHASFVQLPQPGLSVEAEANQLCVAGLTHGTRLSLTFREGLPSVSGEALARDVTITAYVRDRAPAVRFPGRAYVLPRAADAGLPVETVNTDRLDLRLMRVSDRNLVAALRDDYFARSLDTWSAEYLADTLAEVVWTGTAEVGMEVNRDITTRLPVQEVTGALGPGIYALQASVPGMDPYEYPPAIQWFVISDLGLATWSGVDGLTVAVRGLSDAGARAGVAVELVSRANAVIATAPTDAEGVARFAPELTAGRGSSAPALVRVTQGEDMAFLSLTDAEFDLSDRGVEGRPPAPPIDVFLTTDRGAYRAGEVVHATILARDGAARALPGLPLTAVLMRPDGVEYARGLTDAVGAGGHVAAFPIDATAPRGTWRLDIFADVKAPPLASARLLVEDFLPERIDFDLTLPEGPLALAALPNLGLAARYLFGAPGADLEVEGELRLGAAASLPGWEGFRFGRHDETFSPMLEPLEMAQTDAAGQATISLPRPALGPEAALPLEAAVTVRVREGSGRPVERTLTRAVLPNDPVIGIRPLFQGDAVAEGAEAGFQLVALGPNARPVPMQLRWVLNRVETRYQWYALHGSWNWEAVTARTRVSEGTVTLDGTIPAQIAAPVGWGRHELVVERVGGTYAAASIGFDAGWYAAADTIASPDRLELSLDQPRYRAGDTARLRIVAPADGVALVSVLSNRVIALKPVPVTAGESLVDLPVTEEWGAGAYVTASALRPLAGQAGERLPARALGLAHAAVDPGARQLQTRFEVPEAAEPRAALPVALKVEGVAPGDTAHVTIAAVDLGILNLTAFKAPDPSGHYFGQRRLGVGLRDLYGRLIDGRTGAEGIIRSGGDAGRGLQMQAPPPTEELVAYFSGPLVVGADGYARTEVPLPAFNGTVRLMAVAWSEGGVGQAQADVLVRDPVVVTASVPRFLAPGDRARLLLEVVHATGPAGQMALAVTSDGLALEAAPTMLDLQPQGKAKLSIPLRAGQTEGLEQIRVALTSPEGQLLEKTLTVPVQRNDPAVARQSRFDLEAGDTFTLDGNVFAGFVPGSARATLAVGPLARFDTAALLAALDAYPYGCTEQVTSKALPLLYLSEAAEAMGLATPADLRARIDAAITRVLTNQDASGAFGLWQAGSGDLWLDAYATDFLSRARARGHAVPDQAFRTALDNLRSRVNYAADFDAETNDGGTGLAYALMVLAREGAAAVGDLRYYADVKGGDFATALAAAQLGAALAQYGDPTRADAMFARAARMLQTAPADGQLWRADYGTPLRDRAAVLALAAEAGSKAVPLDEVGASVTDSLRQQRLSTQEAAWVLMSTQALIDRPGAEGFTVNGAEASGPLLRIVEDTTAPLAIRNGSGRAQVLTLTTTGVPEVPEPAGGKGYTLTRSYYTPEGAPVDPARVAQGTRLVTVLEITPHGPGAARLLLADPLPAGFEIDNPNLIRGGDLAGLGWLSLAEETQMTEFRQDRFLAALDWAEDTPVRLAYMVRAVTPGEFHHPAASVEDMYRPDYRAQTETGRVTVD